MGVALRVITYFRRGPLWGHHRKPSKRPRSNSFDVNNKNCTSTEYDKGALAVNENTRDEDEGVTSLLAMRVMSGADGATEVPLCRAVLRGSSVESAYGCHYHAYPSESPHGAHGTSLCWSLEKSSIKLYELLCLCRLANSCRKDVVLFDGREGLLFSYRATL
ncbi:uncharacterized protein TEOVI_000595500 [Trypanosoma equiperdum]|uniref:Uncharacterized protein n=1 Tax=Trypanosoma equiperdum TaxID=5694 RepID=A0A1G4I484_TRYEQ|nr:hypothetical protein, conserved [Trypanosoma equiperdum]